MVWWLRAQIGCEKASSRIIDIHTNIDENHDVAHNTLSPPAAISLDGLGLKGQAEDAYHFVVYLPVFGSIYELDGLKQSPISHGAYEEGGEGWLKKARYV